MAAFIIEGGHPLKGSITPQGAKNEALQVLCATLLTDEPVRISNIPDIDDVNNQIRLLQDIGVKVHRHAKGDFTFQANEINTDFVQSDEFLEKLTRWQRVGRFFANGRTRFAIGTILLLAGVYLLIAFLSFVLGAGDADQNQEMYYSTVQNARQLGSIHNVVGAMGATLSETLVRQGFCISELFPIILSQDFASSSCFLSIVCEIESSLFSRALFTMRFN